MAAVERMSLFQKILHLHWWLILVMTALACIGFAIVYSAANGDMYAWMLPQVKRFVLFFFLMLGIAVIHTDYLLKVSYFFYGVAIILLVAVEAVGATVMGAQRWISIGGYMFQPSETMKILLVMALARYFHSMHYKDIGNVLYLIVPIIMALLPFALILKQPDLGTGLIVLMTGGAVFWVAGVRLWKFAVVIAAGLGSIPVAWHYLHDYQKKRILTFLDPNTDPLGAGYNILQSQIAIGSGGFTGKGFMAGSQNKLSFLPEKHTDFIFTMFAEEFGFLGCVGLISLYILFLLFGVFIALNCRNQYGRLLAMGVTTFFFLHMFINMGMVMGMLPVVGAPLPFLSYGGTMLVTCMIGVGLLLNVYLYSDVKLDRNAGKGF
jgi:rod shape determining protein RodA